MLLLFDIDGTLIQSTSETHRRALLDAANRVFSLDLTLADFEATRPDGKTDLLIVRQLLQANGVADAEITAARGNLISAALDHLSAVMEPGSAEILPTVAETLALLSDNPVHRLALLTGNLEPFAWAKLHAVFLAHYFENGQGAFGSDAELRTALGPIALGRAACASSDAVIIGDTPGDIACARACDARVIAAATGRFDATDLADADCVIDSLAELPDVLERWGQA